jgi:hypothetical protein
MLGFVSLGVLGEYAKSLFATAPCKHRYFLRILLIRVNNFCVLGDNFVCILRVRILQIRRKKKEYTERNFHSQQYLGLSKDYYMYWPRMSCLQIKFFGYLLKKICSQRIWRICLTAKTKEN